MVISTRAAADPSGPASGSWVKVACARSVSWSCQPLTPSSNPGLKTRLAGTPDGGGEAGGGTEGVGGGSVGGGGVGRGGEGLAAGGVELGATLGPERPASASVIRSLSAGRAASSSMTARAPATYASTFRNGIPERFGVCVHDSAS